MQVTELKDLCRQEQMQGYSKLKKDELITKLQDADNQLTTDHSSSQQGLANSSAQSPQQPSPVPQQLTASEAEQAAISDLEETHGEGTLFSADTADEEASGSDSASERLWDMTPEQLEGLKTRAHEGLLKAEEG
ncbi:hypothetical protein ABBQ38_013526 [Trebouxia sp. C0009 RCD-2024]